MRIFLASLDELPPLGAGLLALIAPCRRKKALAMLNIQDRDRAVLAGLALREILGITQDADLEIEPAGRPRLARPGPWLSLSHSGPYVALSVGAQEHGLDIQEFRPKTVPESLARWALCPHERLAFGESMDPVLFTRVWAMKEAFVKATGEGLARGLNTFSVWPPESGARKIEGRETHFFLMEAKGAAMALASLAPTSPPPVISLNSNLAGLIEKVNADKDFMPPLTPIYTDYEQ